MIDPDYWQDEDNSLVRSDDKPSAGYIWPRGTTIGEVRIAFVTDRKLFIQTGRKGSWDESFEEWADGGFQGPLLCGHLIWLVSEDSE